MSEELRDLSSKAFEWAHWGTVPLIAMIAIAGILINEYKDAWGVDVVTKSIGGKVASCAAPDKVEGLQDALILRDVIGDTFLLSEPYSDPDTGMVCYFSSGSTNSK